MGRPRWYPTPRRIVLSPPGVGTDFSVRNDSGGLSLVRYVAFRLVTAVGGPNRIFSVNATAGEDVWFRTNTQIPQVGGTTRLYAAFPGSQASFVDANVIVGAWPIEGLWLPPGHVVASMIQGLQAGDQLDQIVIETFEYPEVLPTHLWPMPLTFAENDQE